jgi:hypothetical protein
MEMMRNTDIARANHTSTSSGTVHFAQTLLYKLRRINLKAFWMLVIERY